MYRRWTNIRDAIPYRLMHLLCSEFSLALITVVHAVAYVQCFPINNVNNALSRNSRKKLELDNYI